MADLEALADELYTLPPAQFVAARADVVTAARAAGDKAAASALTALRKPTVTAWLCNQLVRDHRDAVDAAIALGPALRDATVAGDREELRSLARRRTQVLTELVGHARAIADEHDQSMTAGTQRELESTFTAAAADPAAAAAVLTGRLTTALSFEGLGFEQGALPPPSDTQGEARPAARASTPRRDTAGAAVRDSTATPPTSTSKSATQPRDEAAKEAARAAVEEADTALAVARLQQADAAAEVAEAERVLEEALQAESDAAEAYRDAQATLAEARAEVEDATKDATAADRNVTAALAALEKATRRLR